jgi:hypothetical protein
MYCSVKFGRGCGNGFDSYSMTVDPDLGSRGKMKAKYCRNNAIVLGVIKYNRRFWLKG